ncbi:hypothetical protein BGZ79_004490 [Entomortierella chlamydospora]|nr:hypothetical protein BGZ79_004490 [Entomortierella chlamydospora]
MRASLILSAGAILVSSLLSHTDAKQQLCNGYAELCTKTYDKVAYATTHNAYAFSPLGALATNQDYDIPTQLNDGIRALMLDAYNSTTGNATDIELCHTSCVLLDSGPLSKTFQQIKSFMDANPNEVITILWENAGKLTPAHFQAVYAATGLDKYSHTQASGNTTWPTLAQMISSGKRLVSFLDSGADATVPWLMAEYDFIFETPWLILKGAAYPCTVDRPKDQRKQMYVLNHFIYGELKLGGEAIDLPQPLLANQTNGPDLVSHANACQTTFNQIANFIAVDYYDEGSLFQVVAKANGVTSVTKPSATNTTSSGTTGSNSTLNVKSSGGSAVTGINQSVLSAIAAVGGVGMMLL